jgi:hypothetical protein
MHSFEYYKDRVPIVQVAEALGYGLNKKAGGNPLEYKHPDHNTIVISKLKGRERYFTRHESENRGSVIDFVKHRLNLFNEFYNKESEGINKVLASFAGIPFTSPDRKLWLSEKKTFNLNDFELRKADLRDLLYLSKHRGLNEETLQTFMPHILLVKAKNKAIANIGFPYYVPNKITAGADAGDKIVGFELVNYLFKGHARGSNKSDGLWVADLNGTGFPPKVFIAESAIDAMSFYQMFRQKYKLDDSTFLSSGGYVTDRQLRNMINAYPHTLIHTLFDNDLSGHLYDIRTACMKENKNLQIQKTGNQIQFELDKKSLVLPEHLVSLSSFRKESGLRPDIRVHKATEKDFNEMLLDRIQKEQQKSIKM